MRSVPHPLDTLLEPRFGIRAKVGVYLHDGTRVEEEATLTIDSHALTAVFPDGCLIRCTLPDEFDIDAFDPGLGHEAVSNTLDECISARGAILRMRETPVAERMTMTRPSKRAQ